MSQEFNTPMMKQYLGIKKKYQDCLLFYRMGDFYELFLDDAAVGAKVLGITLTSRSKGKDGRIPMAGVPYHAVDSYLHKLVKSGYKVAICEQLSEPNKKGIVDRDVIRIVTPGTIVDESALDRSKNNYIIALTVRKNTLSLSCADLSTGEFLTEEIHSDQYDQILLDELTRLHPAECILSEKDYQDKELLRLLSSERHMSITSVADWESQPQSVSSRLKKCFGVQTLAAFEIEDKPMSQQTCLALYLYLQETQKGKIDHIRTIRLIATDESLIMDRSTIINLELFSTIREHDTSGSLLQSIDETKTAMGARLLKAWMCSPLRTYEKIIDRYDAVDFFIQDSRVRNVVLNELTLITDIERMFSRLSVGIGNARDVRNLAIALEHVDNLHAVLDRSLPSLLSSLLVDIGKELHAVSKHIKETIVENPAITIQDGNLIRPGISSHLDHLRSLVSEGDVWLQELEKREKKRTAISSLKVRYNSVFGYYIDITKSNLASVPSDYIRRQTLVNSERYTTLELKDHESEILSAKEEANRLEYQIYSETLQYVLQYTEHIQRACSAVASIDCLVSFAELARKYSYVRPTLLYSNELRIQDGRHPVVERLLQEEPFVPNSVHLDSLSHKLLVITGPNMAGKSVFIRQTALIVLLSHMGCFVPAHSAYVGTVDRIFVRSGASDVITSGLSTFMVEMVETAHILHHATAKSLIIMDEIGRGTSTYDGISIAWAVATHLVTHTKAKTLFATHYHELQSLEKLHPQDIQNFHMAVTEDTKGPVFLHTLLPGGATSSYGIEVAKLAGIPKDVIEIATHKLNELEKRDYKQKKSYDNERSTSFIEKDILSLALSRITPLEALNILSSYQEKLNT